MSVFRSQLLDGRAVALAGACDSLGDALAGLGARVGAVGEPPAAQEVDAVVFDAADAFGTGGQDGLRAATEAAWYGVHEVATESLIPGEHGGKVVLIGPRPDAGQFAEAARSALENLARTLSIEWARHRVTATMIAPGTDTPDAQLAELVCYLISPAGDYFSGCRFSLGS